MNRFGNAFMMRNPDKKAFYGRASPARTARLSNSFKKKLYFAVVLLLFQILLSCFQLKQIISQNQIDNGKTSQPLKEQIKNRKIRSMDDTHISNDVIVDENSQLDDPIDRIMKYYYSIDNSIDKRMDLDDKIGISVDDYYKSSDFNEINFDNETVKVDDEMEIDLNIRSVASHQLVNKYNLTKREESTQDENVKNKDDFRRKEIAPELNNENDKVQLHPNAEFLRQENTSSNESDPEGINDYLKSNEKTFEKKILLEMESSRKKKMLQEKLREEANDKLVQYTGKKQTYTEQNEFLQDVSCEQDDAFKGIPIDGFGRGNSIWTPPFDAAVDDKKKWTNSYTDAITRIKESDLGGEELRKFALTEVERLKTLRHRLFCMKSILI